MESQTSPIQKSMHRLIAFNPETGEVSGGDWMNNPEALSQLIGEYQQKNPHLRYSSQSASLDEALGGIALPPASSLPSAQQRPTRR